jgi:hypothetical protein
MIVYIEALPAMPKLQTNKEAQSRHRPVSTETKGIARRVVRKTTKSQSRVNRHLIGRGA